MSESRDARLEIEQQVKRLNRSIRRRLKLHGWINHGGFGHPGPQDKHCDACAKGIGWQEFEKQPLRAGR